MLGMVRKHLDIMREECRVLLRRAPSVGGEKARVRQEGRVCCITTYDSGDGADPWLRPRRLLSHPRVEIVVGEGTTLFPFSDFFA